MVTIMANMMTYMNTLKINELTKIKNSVFHNISSIALAKIKINSENYWERLGSFEEYYKLKKMIHLNDRFIGDNYISLIFDQTQVRVRDNARVRLSERINVNYFYEDVRDFEISNININYIEMRYLCHILTPRLQHLWLLNCNITDFKLNCLIGIDLYHLISIALGKNPITNTAIKILSKCKIPNLLTLSFNETNVTPDLIQMIKDNREVFSKLKFLEMIFNDEWNHMIDANEIRELNLYSVLCRKNHLKNFDEKKDKHFPFYDDKYAYLLNDTDLSTLPTVIVYVELSN